MIIELNKNYCLLKPICKSELVSLTGKLHGMAMHGVATKKIIKEVRKFNKKYPKLFTITEKICII